MFKINEEIINIGVSDFEVDLFEGQYRVPNGISYNSYIVLDEKTTIFDTVDLRFCSEWLSNIEEILQSKQPDYLVIQHMEPDHSGSIYEFIKKYPNITLVANSIAFNMINRFFKIEVDFNKIVIKEGDSLCVGKRTFNFFSGAMVHWPEVMVTYDDHSKTLFSADAFGTFGVYKEDDVVNAKEWAEEASRYFIGIVGKYGIQVQTLLKKASSLDIKTICSLHGPILKDNLGDFIELYNIWSTYKPEKEGIVVAYASAYGHTKDAALLLENTLKSNGYENVILYDLARCDMSRAIADTFRNSKLVLASITYNAGISPYMNTFIHGLLERNFQNKIVATIENGSWSGSASKIMCSLLEKSKNISYTENSVSIKSALDDNSTEAILKLSEELIKL